MKLPLQISFRDMVPLPSLEGEIRRNAWITAKPDSSLLGQPHDRALWAEILRSMSPYHRVLAEAPEDPQAN